MSQNQERKRKPVEGSPENPSKRQHDKFVRPSEITSLPGTPRQQQSSAEHFFQRSDSAPLSNIGNSIQPRKLFSSQSKVPIVITINDDDDDNDDCKIIEPCVPVTAGSLRRLKTGNGKDLLSSHELRKASVLAVETYYEKFSKTKAKEIAAERSPICNMYNLLYDKEVSSNGQKFTLLMVSMVTNMKLYPSGEIMHNMLKSLIPKSESFDIASMGLGLVQSILECHPSYLKTMRNFYWNILPSKFAANDPISRWEELRNLLENLKQNSGTEDIANLDCSLPSETIESLLSFYLDIFEIDFNEWSDRYSEDSVTPLIDKKDIPLIAMIVWPGRDSHIGELSKICKDLVMFHQNALVQLNEKLLSFTSKLLNILIKIVHLSENPSRNKVDLARPRLREFARRMAEIFSREDQIPDLHFLFSTFDNPLFLTELSRAFLSIYEAGFGNCPLYLREILKVYLTFGKKSTADDLLAAYKKLSLIGQISLCQLVQSYLENFQVRRLWDLIKINKKVSGFDVSSDGSQYFSAAYPQSQLEKDFRTLHYVVKMCKGSEILAIVFHM